MSDPRPDDYVVLERDHLGRPLVAASPPWRTVLTLRFDAAAKLLEERSSPPRL